MRRRLTRAFWKSKTAAADVDGEGFLHSTWPNLHSSVGDHFQDHSIGSKGLEFRSQRVDLVGPSDEDIRTDEFTGRRFTFFADPDGLPLELYET